MLAELHRHLDGSLRDATLRELGAAAGVDVPADLGFRAGMGLDEALAGMTDELLALAIAHGHAAVFRR